MVVGATFLPDILKRFRCFRKRRNWSSRSFLRSDNFRPERPSVTGGIHSFPVCISEVYEGEGKTALSTLRNQAGEFRIFPRYHSSHPGRVVQRMLTRINVVFRRGEARALPVAGQSRITESSRS